ncbi:MAG: short-chain dehydrogenase/reductase [Catenulispora sp. 13_1_20CM_3_70_7]|nr:MAG: short-chain dehydrogenase/reductase [Catenulispora sp. 13_1_20CM_3_70_7]
MTPGRMILITGVSSGLGRAIADRALAAGHRVVGTVRRPEAVEEFEAQGPGRAFARVLDITDEQAVPATVAAIEAELGPIDVLVANAGYGHEGTFEESTMADLHRQFDVNVFGTVAVMKAVLPGMRERRRGHIFVITSVGGLAASPTLSFYHGSKFAMEGITGSLAAEVAPFGVRVTAVEPGGFRTDWSGRSMVRAARTIPDYDRLMDPIRAARQAHNGKQPGDPARLGDAILRVMAADTPPVHLILGADALRAVAEARAAEQDEIDAWRHIGESTAYPS